jgi:iron complex outermembrane recepter protein
VKPGGHQTSGPILFDNTTIYRREKLTSYELGTKSNLFDRLMTVNVAGFYQDYRDQQVRSQIFNTTLQQLQGVTENAGKTRIWGIELESALRPLEGVTLSANYTYLNAEFTEFIVRSNSATRVAELPDCRVVTLPNSSRICELDRAGLSPPDLPKHRLSLRAEYTTAISDTSEFFIDGIFRYNSRTFADTSNVVIQPSRSVVDGSIGIDRKPLRFSLYVENLFDNRRITDSNLYLNFGGGLTAAGSGYLAEPRKVGVRISAKL